ncbi:MAG: Flp family type IVb pilin [Acidimicrobiia bacterium]
MKALKFARRLWKDEEGATAIEYGLLAALVAVALITVLGTMSGELEATFENVQTSLEGANAGGGGGGGGGGADPAPGG